MTSFPRQIKAPPRVVATGDGYAAVKHQLIDLGREFHARGWSLATSSNYSVVVGKQPLRLLITASGTHKDRLGATDFTVVNEHGRVCGQEAARPSAETLLHTVIADHRGAGAILHTHSIWSTLLSQRHAGPSGEGELILDDFEMLKGLAGIESHRAGLRIPIFDNTQDIPSLAAQAQRIFNHPSATPSHAFLLRRHGLYTWGRDILDAKRHVEALEFLFEVVVREG